jgi:signal transduction histidine kinase
MNKLNIWFRNISISKKLYFTIGIMAFLIVVELLTINLSFHLLSGLRASIQQEGVWSKAQKDAINTLQQYAHSSDTNNYRLFNTFLEVNEWDKKAFTELKKENPSRDIMWEGFVNSGVHPDDGDAITDLFYYFNFISYVEECLDIFWTADNLMMELRTLGDNMHATILQKSKLNTEETSKLFTELNQLNTDLTALEAKFSSTLSEAARWLDSLLLRLLFGIALMVEISGLVLAISLSRGISKGINEVIRVSRKVAAGDFNEKSDVYSKDEIGILAVSFNEMIDEVNRINQELRQFAYIASHDLQEPLNTIANFNTQLDNPNSNWDEEKKKKAKQFIQNAVLRMQSLIKDLMDYSRVGRNVEMTSVNTQKLVQNVVDQLQDAILSANALVTFNGLPTIQGNETELNQLFQNLISNGIKFHSKGQQPIVSISYSSSATLHNFIIKDNGIGIEEKHLERIFAVFQRLHNQKDFPGTGIGLATCKKVVNLHKGQLNVISEVGVGSEFHLSIPKNLNSA